MLRAAALICGLTVALALPASSLAYDWPLRPFKKQHPVRGVFNDPRVGAFEGTAFHMGVDISAPDLTAVYAIEPGKVSLRFQTVIVRGKHRTFSYWHILPAVESGQRVKTRDVVGYIAPGKGHVHLGENKNGRHLNPLRAGGLAPHVDDTKPTIASVGFSTDGKAVQSTAVSGVVDIIVDAYDTPPLKPLRPYGNARVTPSVLRWRLMQGVTIVRPWKLAVDLRSKLFPSDIYWFIFAPGTVHSKPFAPGKFNFYLAWKFDTAVLPNGPYTIEVETEDIQGNLAASTVPFTVANSPATAPPPAP